jgi:antitoxin CptB
LLQAREERLKRLRIRCWRRGTREMDLLLGGFVDRRLAALTDAEIQQIEELLGENDHDIYAWMSGAEGTPEKFVAVIAMLKTEIPVEL